MSRTIKRIKPGSKAKLPSTGNGKYVVGKSVSKQREKLKNDKKSV